MAVRGDAHVLLVGDPGLGKSQLLQAALKKAAVPVALVTVKGGGHGVRGRAVEARVRAFLEFHLYGRGSLPSDQVLTRTAGRRQSR